MDSRPVVRAISKAFLVAGGIIFFFGDRALREIWTVGFAPAEACGIGGGLLLMLLGGAIQSGTSRSGNSSKGSDPESGSE